MVIINKMHIEKSDTMYILTKISRSLHTKNIKNIAFNVKIPILSMLSKNITFIYIFLYLVIVFKFLRPISSSCEGFKLNLRSSRLDFIYVNRYSTICQDHTQRSSYSNRVSIEHSRRYLREVPREIPSLDSWTRSFK